MLVHIDCNNFFASCERIFRPDLENKPIVVLSNNDGCVIARSKEAKALGIAMCQPFFQIRDMERTHGLIVFSANFALYADISDRIMNLIAPHVICLERYSIDECFVEIESNFAFPTARMIRIMLQKELSIPVSIGIGRTKTEAKLATSLAKKNSSDGICNLLAMHDKAKQELYQQLPPRALWGINVKTEDRLKKRGIFSVFQLIQTPPCLLRKWAHVQVERISLELQGYPCLALDEVESPQKQLMHSRSFASPLLDLIDVKEAAFSFACRAAEKLRAQKLVAHMVTFSLIERGPPQEAVVHSTSIALPHPTNCSMAISKATMACVQQLYTEGTWYKKAAVLLSGLILEQHNTPSFWTTEASRHKQNARMNVLDTLTERFGKHALFLGGEGIHRPWQPTTSRQSPRYTSRWDELPIAHAR